MRPNSRGTTPSGMNNNPPGTGMRPGSGRRPPATSRLRTGVAPTGPGMQAAQGLTLSASINVSDRPVTGQGVMGMKTQAQGPGRLVQDPAYFVGILRKRINDISAETKRLRDELDQQDRDAAQMVQLEKRYESSLKSKEALEGQLADYNLALDKTRTATDPDDVHQMALQLAEKNKQTGIELDRIFILRKQRESETQHIEEQIESFYKSIQSRINDLEPGKLRAYNELLTRKNEMQQRKAQMESRLHEVTAQIKQFESDETGYSHRKEYATLEKQIQAARRMHEALSEEYEITSLEPKEAHAKFVARVNGHKQAAAALDEKIGGIKEEISSQKRLYDDLMSTAASSKEDDSGEAAKYELLVKRDQEMTAFMDGFEDNRSNLIAEQRQTQDLIVGLLQHIGQGLEDSSNLPQANAMGELEDAKVFKKKNLETAQRTMDSLQAERRKREKELELLRNSEPKLEKEITSLKEGLKKMRKDMQEYDNIDNLMRTFERTQSYLTELKKSYVKRRDATRQQVQAMSAENESLKKQLNSNDTAKELDETEKRLKNYEKTIFELREFIESKARETDYETIKLACLRLGDSLNSLAVKKCGGTVGGASNMNRK